MKPVRQPELEDFAAALAQVFHAVRLYPEGHPERQRRAEALGSSWGLLLQRHGGVGIDFVQGRLHPDGGAPWSGGGPSLDDFMKQAVAAGYTVHRLEGPTGAEQALQLARAIATGGSEEGQEITAPHRVAEVPPPIAHATGVRVAQPVARPTGAYPVATTGPTPATGVHATTPHQPSPQVTGAIPMPPPGGYQPTGAYPVVTAANPRMTGAFAIPTASPVQSEDGAARAALRKIWASIVQERRIDPQELAQLVRVVARREGDGIVEAVRLFWSGESADALYDHALNMSRLAYLVARAAGLSPRGIEALAGAALLSDVGMLLVPDRLLESSERLRPAEFRIIRRHPVDGARLLFASEGVPDLAAVIAHQHHQRPDGKGYPSSIHATEPIPAAMLIQVVDFYAALRTPRPFRAAVGERETRALIHKAKGERLDERYVELVMERSVPRGCASVTAGLA